MMLKGLVSDDVRELTQALGILSRLRLETFRESNTIAWDKLYSATRHLEQLLKTYLEENKAEVL